MEYALPNILAAAEFDRTAKAIIAVGFEKTVKRFFSKLIMLDNGCITINGKLDPKGYTRIMMSKEPVGISYPVNGHRLMWLLSGLKINKGLVLDHKCKNRLCVNSFHIREVTPEKNAKENSNGLTAVNAKKTHCVHGHEFNEKNTKIIKRNVPGNKISRACIACYDLRLKNRITESMEK